MSFQELLSPEHYECLVKLRHNDSIVAAWWTAITNPTNSMTQDANALMWLVHLLSESKKVGHAAFFKRLQKDKIITDPQVDRESGPRIPRKGM